MENKNPINLNPNQESFVKLANEEFLQPRLLDKILYLYKVSTVSKTCLVNEEYCL